MKRLLYAATPICLITAGVMTCPVRAQEAIRPSSQAEQPEWQTLLDRASDMFDAESRKPETQRNYKAILAIVGQAEESATSRFGMGSSPHLKALEARARYLGLSGSYDAQLEAARKKLALCMARTEKRTLSEVFCHIMFTADLTDDHDGHKAAGAQALQQAADILTALGPIRNDDVALSWLAYAKQMPNFGGANSDRIKILTDIMTFRKSENPPDIYERIKTLWMLGDTYKLINTTESQYSAMTAYRDALIEAGGDRRPENGSLGIAQFIYGDHLLKMGRTVEAELYLEEAVKTLTTPGAGADPDFAQAARESLAAARNGTAGASEVVQKRKPDEEYDGWIVRSEGSYCLAGKQFERGIVTYIEYDDRRNVATFTIRDPSFQSIKSNEIYNLSMDIVLKNGKVPFYDKVPFVGVNNQDYRAITAELIGREFLEAFGQASRVQVKRGEISVADIDVSEGNGRHIAALRRCAETRAKENPSDPFRN